MILMEGDIDLQRNNEQLKAIRRGEWTEERLRTWFADKESQLERVYAESTLRATPDEAEDPGAAAELPGRALRQPGGLRREPRPGGGRPAEHPGRAGAGEGLAMSDRGRRRDAVERLRASGGPPPVPAALRHDQRGAPVRLPLARLGLRPAGLPSPAGAGSRRAGRRAGDDRDVGEGRRASSWTWSRTTPEVLRPAAEEERLRAGAGSTRRWSSTRRPSTRS